MRLVGVKIQDQVFFFSSSPSACPPRSQDLLHATASWTGGKNRYRPHAIILTDSMSLLQKVKSGTGRPDWMNVSMVDIHLPKLLWVYCPGHAGVKGNDRADRLAGKATLTRCLLLGRSEVLRSSRHYLRAQSHGHHTTDRLKESGVERGSVRCSSLKGRERVIVSQTNIGTVSKCDVRETSERRGAAHMGFSERTDTILN